MAKSTQCSGLHIIGNFEGSEQQRCNSIFCQNVFLVSNFSEKNCLSGNNNGVTPFYITLKLMASEAKTKPIKALVVSAIKTEVFSKVSNWSYVFVVLSPRLVLVYNSRVTAFIDVSQNVSNSDLWTRTSSLLYLFYNPDETTWWAHQNTLAHNSKVGKIMTAIPRSSNSMQWCQLIFRWLQLL